MEKVWEVRPRKFDDLVEQLLSNRGIVDLGEKETFFHPDFLSDSHDPYLMKGIKEAVARIKKAKENNEIIGLFADYDADGIPGAALLYKTLHQIGLEAIVYIPNREGGYGLSKEGIDYLVSKKCTLLITIDLGIRNTKEAEYCQKIDLDLIVTDHHLPGDVLPEADILINPKQKGDKYPYKDLCGCGVAYKLAHGLSKTFPKEIDEKFLKWNLDLVAISSVCDVVPLDGENRILAKFGLMVINKTKNIGLAELISVSGLKAGEISAYHLGFQLGPRINAPGRIDHATKSFELLVTEDRKEAHDLALWLNEKNEDRQVAMEETINEAIKKVEAEKLFKHKLIVVCGKWQKGVIGPSASKLVDKYNRPVILFAEDGECLTGSARSVSGVNIVVLFEKIKEHIYKFGGHKGAAGITVYKTKFATFLKKIMEIADTEISDDDLIKKVRVDCPVEMKEMTKSLYEKLLLFEPFGMGNTKPVFMLKDIQFDYPKFVGKNSDHFSSLVSDGAMRAKTIYFNFPYEKDIIKKNKSFDIAFSLSLDEWQGESKISFNIIDLKSNG